MGATEIAGLILLGLFAGTLAATLGVGGGIIFVPVLASVFAFAQLEAQATSLAIILPTVLVASTIHARAGRVVWKVAFVAGGFGLVSAFLGANVAIALDEGTLRKVFSVVVALLAIRMARRAFTLRAEASQSMEAETVPER